MRRIRLPLEKLTGIRGKIRLGGLGGRLRSLGRPFVIGIILIFFAAFGVFYYQQQQQQNSLSSQVALINRIMEQAQEGTEELEAELARAEEDLAAAQDLIPSNLQRADVYEAVVALDSDGILDRNTVQPSPDEEDLGNNTYQVFRCSDVTAVGTFEQVMAFIISLESAEEGALRALVLDDVTFSDVGGGQWGASVDFHVYAWPEET